jgi:uncharacterized membrane protein
MHHLVLTILGLLLASIGQALLVRQEHELVASAAFISAVVLIAVAFRPLSAGRAGRKQQSKPNWDLRGLLALLAASLPAWIGGWLLAVRWNSLVTGAALYALGLSTVLLVCARREGWTLPRPRIKRHWLDSTAVGLVLAVGLFLLVYRLDYYPPPGGISWNDEAQIGKDAYGVIHHGYRPWQFPLSIYTTTLSFVALGPSVLALRLPFVLMGFLTLVVFYLLARELFRFPVAIAATFLFAVSRWHIAFSRLVLPSTPAMLLEVSTFYFLLRGRRTAGMMNYVLAGLTMGLGLYSHASFRIVPILVGVLFGCQALSSWRARRAVGGKPLVRVGRWIAPWLVFLASAIVVTLPLFSIVRREPQVAFGERFTSVMPALFARADAVQQDGLMDRAQRLLGFFNYKGESWGAVNLPGWPMLDPVTGILFLLGLGYCLIYFWRNGHPFYLSWFLITLIGGGLLTVDLRSHRFAGMMPVLFIFAAVFLDAALSTFERALGSDKQRYLALFLVPLLVTAGCVNYRVFFHRQISAADVRMEFTRDVSAIANYIGSLGEGHYVYLFANYPYYSPGMDFAWMAGEMPGQRGIDVLDVIPSRRTAGDEDLVYIFVTPYNVHALAQALRYFYPRVQTETFYGEYGRYTFVAAHVDAEETDAIRGLLGYYYERNSGQFPALVRRDPQVCFDWRSGDPPVAPPIGVEWRGSLYAPADDQFALEMEPAGRCQIYLDDLAVENGQPLGLVKGWHKLVVACPELEGSGFPGLVWTAPDRPRDVVPSQFLSPREEVNGVLVSVFEGPDASGEPVEQSIQLVLSLFRVPTAWQSGFTPELAGKPYSLDCRGELQVENPGSYRFDLMTWNGNASLWIDGTRVASAQGVGKSSGSGAVQLAMGWHDLQVRYSYQGGEFSGVDILWTPPGGETQTISPALLRPVGEVITRSASLAP